MCSVFLFQDWDDMIDTNIKSDLFELLTNRKAKDGNVVIIPEECLSIHQLQLRLQNTDCEHRFCPGCKDMISVKRINKSNLATSTWLQSKELHTVTTPDCLVFTKKVYHKLLPLKP